MTLSRRTFFTLSSSVLITSTTLGTAYADVEKDHFFDHAATKYQVPAALLAAISYIRTQWQPTDRQASGSIYGPLGLIDGEPIQDKRKIEGKAENPTVNTLGLAATVTGLSIEQIRKDASLNIEAGAGLLAYLQKNMGHPLGVQTGLESWSQSITIFSGLSTLEWQQDFTRKVFKYLSSGINVEDQGITYRLKSRQIDFSAVENSFKAFGDSSANGTPRLVIDGPADLPIESVVAPYEQYTTQEKKPSYGNHDIANRPEHPSIRRIVIHDTEETYDRTIKLVTNPTYLAWNYTLRSSDGHVAQHLNVNDIGWHTGNWYYNMHSIGLEHEGKALEGAQWYTDQMYESSAKLTSHLAQKYKIPLTRGHILGHDQIPGIDPEHIAQMHWDPGVYWNWSKYFSMIGSPLEEGTHSGQPKVGDAIRILPDFDTNVQEYNGDRVTGLNFVTVRQEPSDSAPRIVDQGLAPTPATTQPKDVGARLPMGCDYVVARTQDDWIAIWFLGQLAWFKNLASNPVARIVDDPYIITLSNDSAPFGCAFPDPDEYPNSEWVQEMKPLPYSLKAGQQYVCFEADIFADYYRSKTFDKNPPEDHVLVQGNKKYVGIYMGYRQGFLKVKDIIE